MPFSHSIKANRRIVLSIVCTCLIVPFLTYLCYPMDSHMPMPRTMPASDEDREHYLLEHKAFADALAARYRTDPDTGRKIIILSSVDSAYLDEALNLWETSFLRHGIEYYLFICTDKMACLNLTQRGIACFKGTDDPEANTSSYKGTVAFSRKTLMKIDITLQALRLGYSVLLTDVDIIFLKNPFPYLDCSDCDIQVQSAGSAINSGFMFVIPTDASIRLHERALKVGLRTECTGQDALNIVLGHIRGLKYVKLSEKLFPRGITHFEDGKRMFALDLPCPDCVIVHNNWMQDSAAKAYRFKESLFWTVDTDGYYTNPRAKYLTYNNPYDYGAKTTEIEMDALRSALRIGHLLNRSVVLPEFHCYGCSNKACQNAARHCSLNAHIKFAAFDEQFRFRYREHTFLSHPKVPDSVLASQSPVVYINTGFDRGKTNQKDIEGDMSRPQIIFTPKNHTLGASSKEILHWFRPFDGYSILCFYSLYGAAKGVSSGESEDIESRLKAAFRKSGYRQWV